MTDALEKLQALRERIRSCHSVSALRRGPWVAELDTIIASLTDEGWVDAGEWSLLTHDEIAPPMLLPSLNTQDYHWANQLAAKDYTVRLRPVQDGEGEG